LRALRSCCRPEVTVGVFPDSSVPNSLFSSVAGVRECSARHSDWRRLLETLQHRIRRVQRVPSDEQKVTVANRHALLDTVVLDHCGGGLRSLIAIPEHASVLALPKRFP